MTDTRWWKSSVTVLAVGVLLCAAGTALAASDLSDLVSTSDGDAATGRAAQQPLGTLSETDTPQVLGNQDEGTTVLGQQPGGGGGDEGSNEVLGAQPGGGSDAGADDGDELPFTGLLAIPLLGIGAVLLLAGAGLRRRTPRTVEP